MGEGQRVAMSMRFRLVALGLLVVGCSSAVVPPTSTPLPATASPIVTPSSEPTPSAAPPTSTPTPTPTPTDLPTPTSALTPSPFAPTPTPVVDGIRLDEAAIASHLDALADIAEANGGIRAPGSAGYDASAVYIAQQLAAMGLQVERQPFDFTTFSETAPVSLAVDGESWAGPDWLHANVYSAAGQISAVAESVGIRRGRPTETSGCISDDWEGFGAGHVAVVFGAFCPRRQVVSLAQEADAAALVSLYPDWAEGKVLQPTLFDPAGIEIPAVVAGTEPAAALLAAARTGTTIEITVDVESSPATDENVLGQLAGSSDRVLMLGGHLDSVLDGPGINDNGSGVATLLAIADALAEQPAPNLTVRFAFWGAEEFGILGSTRYVDSLSAAEQGSIDAYVNLDMVASPNAGRYVYDDELAVPGSSELTQILLDALEDAGAPGIAIPSGGSDHVAFQQVGIRTSGVFSGLAPLTPEDADLFGAIAGQPADPCYHLPCDDRDNVDVDSAMTFGTAVAVLVERLAFD